LILDPATERCWHQIQASDTFRLQAKRHLWFFTHYDILLSSFPSVHDITTARIEIPIMDKEAKPEEWDMFYWQAATQSRSQCGIVVPYMSDVGSQLQADVGALKEWRARQTFLTYRTDGPSTGRQFSNLNCNRCDVNKLRYRSFAVGDAFNGHFDSSTAAKVNLGRVTISEYTEELINSKYCLVIRGDTPSTHALYDTIAAGCVPIIVSDDKEAAMPFAVSYGAEGPSGGLSLWNFSIRIEEAMWLDDVDSVVRAVMNVDDDQIRSKIMVEALANAGHDLLWQIPNSKTAERVLTEVVNRCI
jgi:hypothetical protein